MGEETFGKKGEKYVKLQENIIDIAGYKRKANLAKKKVRESIEV